MQIANEFGREGGGGLGSITGAGPPPDDFSYGAKPGAHQITQPQASAPVLPSTTSKGGAFIIGLIILGMSGFRA
jgi:hypothetical protein